MRQRLIWTFIFSNLLVLPAFSIKDSRPFLTSHQIEGILVSELTTLSVRELRKITGQGMPLMEQISFALLKSKMKKAVKKDPSITVGEFKKSLRKKSAGGIVLGVLLGLVLVFFALFLMLFPGDSR